MYYRMVIPGAVERAEYKPKEAITRFSTADPVATPTNENTRAGATRRCAARLRELTPT